MSDSDDEPLAQRKLPPSKAVPAKSPAARKPADEANTESAVNGGVSSPVPSGGRRSRSQPQYADAQSSDSDEDDEEDDVPLASKRAKKTAPQKRTTQKRAPAKRKRAASDTEDERPAKPRRGRKEGGAKAKKWTTLFHAGVQFPPDYEAHEVKPLYDGIPVDLTPEQEEVASMYAVMLETDYMKKPIFKANFWEGFKPVLGKNHVIKDLDKCDFRPIYEHLMAERDKKKNLPREVKMAQKALKDEEELHFKVAKVDGRDEPVGNFRVEPPGLFRGRGEHPKMGRIKSRIYPRDITINIGKGEALPEHPYPGQSWKEVRHDDTVTWLAFWKDPINVKEYKYVWLAANSTFKADSDLAKYELARKLKHAVDGIRAEYRRGWRSKSIKEQQMGVALYFIDRLALRAGHEKDEDEADTVGCCNLKAENVEAVEDCCIKFDFLGKDSIKYENTVKVDEAVYECIERFKVMDGNGKKKRPEDQLFDTMDASDLNTKLKDLMDGLSVKVFRTYNASVTLDRLLWESHVELTGGPEDIVALKAEYDRANKEVAVLCNHQRAVPKAHDDQMGKMNAKLDTARAELEELESGKGGEASEKRIRAKKGQIAKMMTQLSVKEDLKSVALGTSKINYMDPRISIAWCKRHEVPIEKIFNKSLLTKFNWAMEVEADFKF